MGVGTKHVAGEANPVALEKKTFLVEQVMWWKNTFVFNGNFP